MRRRRAPLTGAGTAVLLWGMVIAPALHLSFHENDHAHIGARSLSRQASADGISNSDVARILRGESRSVRPVQPHAHRHPHPHEQQVQSETPVTPLPPHPTREPDSDHDHGNGSALHLSAALGEEIAGDADSGDPSVLIAWSIFIDPQGLRQFRLHSISLQRAPPLAV